MLRGLYQAAQGMKVRAELQEIVANNLANAATGGFQREVASVMARAVPRPDGPRPLPRREGAPAPPAQPAALLSPFAGLDTRSGPLRDTGAAGDIALEGSGYLVARGPDGPRLTRGGPTRVTREGLLATQSGEPLLAASGEPIRVGSSGWRVGPDGTVTADGQERGRLRVVRAGGSIRREGGSLLSAGALQDAPPGTVRVLQGFLEGSNVEPVREMVDMIAGVRAYESAQRAVSAHDQTLGSLLGILQR